MKMLCLYGARCDADADADAHAIANAFAMDSFTHNIKTSSPPKPNLKRIGVLQYIKNYNKLLCIAMTGMGNVGKEEEEEE